jgi:outer membrane receptor protein involved in Fe transport
MTADQIVSIFTHYQYSSNLAFNIGLNYVSDREARNRLVSAASRIEEIADDYKMSAYANLDLSVIYDFKWQKLKATKVKLLIKNLTDTQYYTATTPGVRENFAEGRFFQLSFEVGI